ncbi:MAG: Gfo/Idh/MocA family oxidoreductase [Rubrivivax sp.]|nr:Gfo/Idh/MocA family oxidoreductase [Rubrivivax sp.]
MAKYRVGIIGVGYRARPDGQARKGMAWGHGKAYAACPETEVVALADIEPAGMHQFAKDFKLKPAMYDDAKKMLKEAELDIVSICVWPHLHAPMVEAAVRAEVMAIHCEKPMAPTWGEAKRMAAACAEAGIQLTFNHQRRFGHAYRKAKELLKAGLIGELKRLEASCDNLMDWGTHWFDMLNFYNDDEPVEWVLAQFDKRTDKAVFGLQHEDEAICRFQYANGVAGYLETGPQRSLMCQNRLIGTTGTIEVGAASWADVRYRNDTTKGWQAAELPKDEEWTDDIVRAIADVVACLKSGHEPVLSARRALQATELIFAAYESSRRHGRVDLPLDQDDSALLTMLEQGLIGPKKA